MLPPRPCHHAIKEINTHNPLHTWQSKIILDFKKMQIHGNKNQSIRSVSHLFNFTVTEKHNLTNQIKFDVQLPSMHHCSFAGHRQFKNN